MYVSLISLQTTVPAIEASVVHQFARVIRYRFVVFLLQQWSNRLILLKQRRTPFAKRHGGQLPIKLVPYTNSWPRIAIEQELVSAFQQSRCLLRQRASCLTDWQHGSLASCHVAHSFTASLRLIRLSNFVHRWTWNCFPHSFLCFFLLVCLHFLLLQFSCHKLRTSPLPLSQLTLSWDGCGGSSNSEGRNSWGRIGNRPTVNASTSLDRQRISFHTGQLTHYIDCFCLLQSRWVDSKSTAGRRSDSRWKCSHLCVHLICSLPPVQS